MALNIYWTDFSKSQLKEIYKYYSENVSKRVAKKIVTTLVQESEILLKQSKSGQIEHYLIHRDEEFRYLVCNNYKIIYWINKGENRIEIVDVFDSRQNPTKMKRV